MQERKVLAQASIPGQEPNQKKLVPKSDIYTLALEVKFLPSHYHHCRTKMHLIQCLIECLNYLLCLSITCT